MENTFNFHGGRFIQSKSYKRGFIARLHNLYVTRLTRKLGSEKCADPKELPVLSICLCQKACNACMTVVRRGRSTIGRVVCKSCNRRLNGPRQAAVHSHTTADHKHYKSKCSCLSAHGPLFMHDVCFHSIIIAGTPDPYSRQKTAAAGSYGQS